MTAGQTSFPIAQSIFKFAQYGQSGAWLSELLHTAKIADDLCFVRSVHTEQINHDPAVTFAQTGFQLAGRPSPRGSPKAWVPSQDLPAFVVMITGNGQSLAERQWGGIHSEQVSGRRLRSVGDPALYVSNPEGFEASQRARFIEDLERLNQFQYEATENPEIATRIAQYEMAFRMQRPCPSSPTCQRSRSTPSSCTVPIRESPGRARRIVCWRGAWPSAARFIQLYHRVGSSLRAADERHDASRWISRAPG